MTDTQIHMPSIKSNVFSSEAISKSVYGYVVEQFLHGLFILTRECNNFIPGIASFKYFEIKIFIVLLLSQIILIH